MRGAQEPRAGDAIGTFRIVALLGRGGMGAVYRAHDAALGRDVALKVLLPFTGSVTERADARDRLAREIESMGRVVHPNVLRVHGSGFHAGEPFVVLELVTGGSLQDRIEREKVPWREACALAAQIARGLGAIHGAGIVHRDLKPANVLLDEEGRPKVADFGLSKPQGAASLTASGTVVGTPAYLSPEQANGAAAVPASDLYALGCVLHALLAGSPPFEGSPLELMRKHLTERAPSLRARGVVVPDALETLVAALLAKGVPERPSSASAVAIALEKIAEGDETRSARRPLALLGGLGIGAVAVALIALRVAGEAPPPVPPQPPPALIQSSTPAPLPPPRQFADGGRAERLLGEKLGEGYEDLQIPLALAFTDDGAVVSVVRGGRVYILWPGTIRDTEPFRKLQKDDQRPVTRAALSPGGRWLAIGRGKPVLELELYETRDPSAKPGLVKAAPVSETHIVQFAVTDSGRVFLACSPAGSEARHLEVAEAPRPGEVSVGTRDPAVGGKLPKAMAIVPPDGFAIAREVVNLHPNGVLANPIQVEGGSLDALEATFLAGARGGRVFTVWLPPSGMVKRKWMVSVAADGAGTGVDLKEAPTAIAVTREGDRGVVALASENGAAELRPFTVRQGLVIRLEKALDLTQLGVRGLERVALLAISPDGKRLAVATQHAGLYVLPLERR